MVKISRKCNATRGSPPPYSSVATKPPFPLVLLLRVGGESVEHRRPVLALPSALA